MSWFLLHELQGLNGTAEVVEKNNFSDRRCDSNTGQACYEEFCQHSYIGQGYNEVWFSFIFSLHHCSC